MAKPEWGTKRTCTSCGAKFYDFQKTPIICPKCKAENQPQVLLKPKRAPPTAPPKPAKAPAKEEVSVDEKDLAVNNEEGDAVVGSDDDDDGVVLDDDEVALAGRSGEAEDADEEDEESDGPAGDGATDGEEQPPKADAIDQTDDDKPEQ